MAEVVFVNGINDDNLNCIETGPGHYVSLPTDALGVVQLPPGTRSIGWLIPADTPCEVWWASSSSQLYETLLYPPGVGEEMIAAAMRATPVDSAAGLETIAANDDGDQGEWKNDTPYTAQYVYNPGIRGDVPPKTTVRIAVPGKPFTRRIGWCLDRGLGEPIRALQKIPKKDALFEFSLSRLT